jgi:hypothetical protein
VSPKPVKRRRVPSGEKGPGKVSESPDVRRVICRLAISSRYRSR